jgi:glycyl-tRNA synthetase beta chain
MQNAPLQDSIYNFLLDRFEFYLRDSRGIHAQVARAIRNAGTTVRDYEFYPNLIGYGNIADFAEELNRQRGNEEIQTIAELLKRTSNILRQADERGLPSLRVSEGALEHPVEIELQIRVSKMPPAILRKYRERNYSAIISDIAELREPLSQFFESVMVMVEDPTLRQARLWLLSYTKKIVGWAADFSELASI